MNLPTRLYARLSAALDGLAPVADLALRLAVAEVFLKSGLNKIQSWESTLALFEYEYAVPLLPPVLAAYLGTAAELALPGLLALGFLGRIPALGLFLFNIVAVVSYPDLSDSGLQFHILWGLLLAVTLTRGPGAFALDRLLGRWFETRRPPAARRAG
jgi:putative oxidoreductase